MVEKSKSRKKLVLTITCVAAIVAAGVAFAKYKNKKNWLEKIETQIVKVERRDLKKELILTGKVLPSSSVDVYSPSSGTLTELFVKEGDAAKIGARLFSVLQDTNGQQELESLRNEVQRTKLELKASEESLQRRVSVKDLFSEAENIKLSDDASRRALEYKNAREKLALLEEKLGIGENSKKSVGQNAARKIFMTAPASGIVTYINKSVGESVFGTTENINSTGREILTISNTQKMLVRSRVLEADLASVKLGMSVQVEMDAFKNISYVGNLSRISQQGVEDKGAGYTYFVTDVEIEKPDANVRALMNATLTLQLAESKNVLSLPVSAVATLGKHSVLQKVPKFNGEIKYQNVEVGLVTDKWVEVKNVNEGESFFEIDFSKINLKKLGDGTLLEKQK